MSQEFIDALQEQPKVDFIKSLFTAMMVTAGKGLSQEDFTTVLKDKLANIEGSHFKGVHADIAALETAHPAINAEAGSYAYVKAAIGAVEKFVMLDGGAWIEHTVGSSGSAMTASQIKSLYESNGDSNAFTDAMKATLAHLVATKDLNLDNLAHDLDVVVQRTHGIDFVAGIPTDPDSNNKQDHIELAVPMQMQVAQQVPQDPATALASREYMTIGSVSALMNQFQTLVMKDKGAITDIGDIAETGIYEGTNVVGSPIQGEIMVMANKDSHGDFGYFLMGDDRTMHTGGKKAGGVLGWQQVKHVAQSTGEIAVEVSGGFTTIKTNMYTNLFGTDLMDGDEHVVTFIMTPNSPEIPDGDPAWGYMLPHVADQTSQPIRLKSAGLAGTPNGVLKLWIDKKALVTIKKTDSANIESDWEVTHVEIPANGGASHLTHEQFVTGVMTKTVGVGKDFEKLHDALRWVEHVTSSGSSFIELLLDDGVHVLGGDGEMNPSSDNLYEIKNTGLTVKSASKDASLCTITLDSFDDGDAGMDIFSLKGSSCYFIELTIDPILNGYKYHDVTSMSVKVGSTVVLFSCVVKNSRGIHVLNGGAATIQRYYMGARTIPSFYNNDVGMIVNNNGFALVKEALFDGNTVGIQSDHAGSVIVISPTFTNNTKDTSIPLNEIQNDGSFISDGTAPLHHKGGTPPSPTSDGEYVLTVVGGVSTWGLNSGGALIYDAYLLGSSVNDDVALSIYHKFDGQTEETRNATIDLTDGQEYLVQPMYQSGLTDAHILDSVNMFASKSFADQSHTHPHPDQLYNDLGNPILGSVMKAWVNAGATIIIKYDSVFGGLKATIKV